MGCDCENPLVERGPGLKVWARVTVSAPNDGSYHYPRAPVDVRLISDSIHRNCHPLRCTILTVRHVRAVREKEC